MRAISDSEVECAPEVWKYPCTYTEIRLHQLSPYIGKLKSSIASDLVKQYTSPGGVVLDPFCGSGTIPLECAIRGRHVMAFDSNPYAILLTRAKLNAPSSAEEAILRLEERLEGARTRKVLPENQIPPWVRQFFHPETLQEALSFADECLENDDDFNLACLLGILHHQRPGFLSYPSSHLVPYLRDKKFPKERFPELYIRRSLEPRLLKKIQRTLRGGSINMPSVSRNVYQCSIKNIPRGKVDAIITSPPYMNALDYVRDNRLRMWLLDRRTENYSLEPTDKRNDFLEIISHFVQNALPQLKKGGACVLVVGEMVRRKHIVSHPAEEILKQIYQCCHRLRLERVIADLIPDVRRSRRGSSATKKELIFVLRQT
jgi:SAM-dependent methyltransferase